MSAAPFTVLLVEDDPNDVFFIRNAFERAGIADAPRVARDGEEALAYLLGQGAFSDRRLNPAPSLVLLDLKLPRLSGLEFLAWRARQEARLRCIPVVVLTSSQSPEDLAKAYELGANSYLVKPLESAAQLEMVKTLHRYWSGLNKLPG